MPNTIQFAAGEALRTILLQNSTCLMEEQRDILSNSSDRENDLPGVIELAMHKIEEDEAKMEEIRQRIVRYRHAIMQTMEEGGLRRLKLSTAILSLQNIRPRPEVDDKDLIPAAFFELKPVLNMERLRDALTNGLEIPGVRLKNGHTRLTIRRPQGATIGGIV
jgi:hypothetical protein